MENRTIDLEFKELLQQCYDDLVNYSLALCSRDTRIFADDLLQETVLKALKGFEGMRDMEKFRSWIFTILNRTYVSMRRRYYLNRIIPFSRMKDGVQPELASKWTENMDDYSLLLQALDRLPNKSRTALLLFEIGGFSQVEIAEIQGDHSISAVKSRISRGRQRLKEEVENLLDHPRPRLLVRNLKLNGELYEELKNFIPERD